MSTLSDLFLQKDQDYPETPSAGQLPEAGQIEDQTQPNEMVKKRGRKKKIVETEPDSDADTRDTDMIEAQPKYVYSDISDKETLAAIAESHTPPMPLNGVVDTTKKRRRKSSKSKGETSYVSILNECIAIANKREAKYGDVKENFHNIREICKVMFGLDVSETDIVKIMIATKWSRQKNESNHDNLIDATTYTSILAKLLLS